MSPLVDLSAKYKEETLAYDEQFVQALRSNGLDMPVRLIEALSLQLETVSKERPEDAFTRESALMGSVFLGIGIALERLGAVCFALKYRQSGFLLKYLRYTNENIKDIYRGIASTHEFRFGRYFDLPVELIADPSIPEEVDNCSNAFDKLSRYLPLAAERFIHPSFPLNSIKHGTLFFRDLSFLLHEQGTHFLGERATKENDSLFFLVKPKGDSPERKGLTTIRMPGSLDLSFSGFTLSQDALENFHAEISNICVVTEDILCIFISYCRRQRSPLKAE